MRRKIILVATIFIACSSCSREKPPTADECQGLLGSSSATPEEVRDFIERAKHELEAMPHDRVDVHSERLGLCTGALMRKAGQIK